MWPKWAFCLQRRQMPVHFWGQCFPGMPLRTPGGFAEQTDSLDSCKSLALMPVRHRRSLLLVGYFLTRRFLLIFQRHLRVLCDLVSQETSCLLLLLLFPAPWLRLFSFFLFFNVIFIEADTSTPRKKYNCEMELQMYVSVVLLDSEPLLVILHISRCLHV